MPVSIFRWLEWAVAGSLAGWAVARLTAADRAQAIAAPAAPLLSFTPHATAAGWASALVLRGRGPSAAAALAAAALSAVVAPRAVRRRQPAAAGPALRVLTVNLLVGGAAEDAVVRLVRRSGADVAFVQELTDDAAERLKEAGLTAILTSERLYLRGNNARGSGIYARYPLTPGRAVPSVTAAQPTARLELPSGVVVELVCVHLRPPLPMTSRPMVARWAREMSLLPAPGDEPVILAGDFNATVDHSALRRLLRIGYRDAASQVGRGLVPTWRPGSRRRRGVLTLDHVLVSAGCAVRAAAVYPVPGSDHRAVYAELQLPGRPAGRQSRATGGVVDSRELNT